MQLAANDLEGDIAAERQADQREARRRPREQGLGHRGQRILLAKHEDAAVVRRVQRRELRGVEALVAEMGAGKGEAGTRRHGGRLARQMLRTSAAGRARVRRRS
jgi:hypothetical protein